MNAQYITGRGRRVMTLLLLAIFPVLLAAAPPEATKPVEQPALPDYKEWNDRSAAQNARGQFEEALEAAERALELNPKYSFAWNNKCVALIGLGRHKEALEAAEQALTTDPRNAVAWTNKALVYRRLERQDDALKAMEQAVRLDDRNPLIWYNKACYHAIYKDRPNALKSLARALELEPKLRKLASKDMDLESLKDDPEFKKLIDR